MPVMDALDRKLLMRLQTAFPLVPRPFAALGAVLGLTEDEVLARLARLKEEGVVRRFGAFFDPARLGYYSTLCALAVPPERLEDVAALINGYEGVTHNYLREHAYNLWFTLIAASRAQARQTLEQIQERTGLVGLLELPAVRRYKIRVIFDLDGSGDRPAEAIAAGETLGERSAPEFSPREKMLLHALQADLPLEPAPFARMAASASLTEEEVLAGLRELLAKGVVRRFGPALRHRQAGFAANAMVVWQVPQEKVPAAAALLAASPHVTHCYERVRRPGWPYNLYTMVHGADRDFCRRVVAALAQAAGIGEYAMLFSSAELKKSTMRYIFAT